MDANFLEESKNIVGKLQWLEAEYKAAVLDAFFVLLQSDPHTAKLAIETFNDSDKAAVWFGDHIGSLGGRTPWECLAQGNVEQVRQVLNAIIYGIPP